MKKIYTIITAFLLTLSSCNDWLDVELDNKVDDRKLFSTAAGFREALAGVYSELSKSSLYGQVLTMEYMDLNGQYYSYGAVSDDYRYWKDFDYANNRSKGTIGSIWNGLYHNIGQLNCILWWADKNRNVMTETERAQVVGEALGLRAYLHFDLYRLFSPDVKRQPQADGIPYNKEYGVSLPPMYTAEEAVQLVLNDLKEAETSLAGDPITRVIPYKITTDDETAGAVVDAAAKNEADRYVARMNLYAVKALMARVYQARGEYTKAVEKAREVIDCGKFRLLDFGSVDQSEKQVDLLFSDEHIFSLRNQEIPEYSKRLHQRTEYGNGVTENTKLPFRSSSSLYEDNKDDVRLGKWFSKRGEFIKFLPDSANIHYSKMPMIRLSEMYLLVAECTYHSDPATALQQLNILRDHRIRNNRPWASLTQDYIVKEMKREFPGEGQMWYVYKRNNLPIPVGRPEGDFEPDDKIFVLPFPNSEIEEGHRNPRK